MAPAGTATRTTVMMLAMAVLLLSSSVTCTVEDTTQTAASDLYFADNAKDKTTATTWAEWAQDKISAGFGFRQDDGKGDHHMAEKSKIEFDSPVSAAAFDANQKKEDAKDGVEARAGGLSAAMSQATGRVTDAYAEVKARMDSFDRKTEEEIAMLKP